MTSTAPKASTPITRANVKSSTCRSPNTPTPPPGWAGRPFTGTWTTGAGAIAVSYTHLDVYKRQEVKTPTHENIYVNQARLDLFVGESVQLTASPTNEDFTWSSDDRGVATVTANGLVEAVGEGVTNIIVKSGELSREIPITAITRIPLEDVIFSENEVCLLYTSGPTWITKSSQRTWAPLFTASRSSSKSDRMPSTCSRWGMSVRAHG